MGRFESSVNVETGVVADGPAVVLFMVVGRGRGRNMLWFQKSELHLHLLTW